MPLTGTGPDTGTPKETEMKHLSKILAVTLALAPLAPLAARADDGSAAAYAEMQTMLGGVPSMFKAFPKVGVAGAWTEFKTLQLNPDTALSGKTKELIGLAVAAQIPCTYCVYFHTKAAKAQGASDEEIGEAVAMSGIVRHWSTVLNGMQVDQATFRAEVDAMMGAAPAKSN